MNPKTGLDLLDQNQSSILDRARTTMNDDEALPGSLRFDIKEEPPVVAANLAHKSNKDTLRPFPSHLALVERYTKHKKKTKITWTNMPDKCFCLTRILAALLLVAGAFLAVEAKAAIPDLSSIDIGLTDGDEAALFDRDHRGVATNE